MKKIFNYIWEHASLIVCRVCSLVWGVIGLGCLFAAYQLWNYLSSLQTFLPIGKGMEILMVTVVLLFGILFLLYAVVQFTREKDTVLTKLFQKRIPNVILIVFSYIVLIFLLCFFTVGEITLKARYAAPLLIVGIVLLFLDLCTNLGLFPDQWERSALIQWVLRRRKKNNR